MKLYDFTPAPNPRRVRMFLAEKGVSIPMVQVVLLKGEQKLPDDLLNLKRWHGEVSARPSAAA